MPLFRWLHECIARNGYEWYLSRALYAAVLGHIMIVLASARVPGRLGWKQDLAKLGRFNRRIFWVYGSYIVICILGFAVLTWRLHDALVRATRAHAGLRVSSRCSGASGCSWMSSGSITAIGRREMRWSLGMRCRPPCSRFLPRSTGALR